MSFRYFALLAAMVCALVNCGNFGAADTVRRWQVARWIRLGEPIVLPADVNFGVIGRNGVRHAIYGIGQSLVILPLDALADVTVRPIARHFGLEADVQRHIAELFLSFVMQWAIAACSLALVYRVLIGFQFSSRAALAGVFSLLFGTTYLQYIQCAQENNLLLLMSLCSLYAMQRFRQSERLRWAILAGTACGFAVLTRLPSLFETTVIFILAVWTGANLRKLAIGFAPPVAISLALDRWYHWARFGELFSTYIGVYDRQARAGAQSVFSFPFWKGFLGALFSTDKSIFFFDPLLLVLALIAASTWRFIPIATRRSILSFSVLLFLYNAAYATYYDFGGDVAWGHRFLTLPVQLLCLFTAPLLLTQAKRLPDMTRAVAWAALFTSVVLQLASTTLSPNLEILQRQRGDRLGVIVNRAINLAQPSERRIGEGRYAGIPIEFRTLNYFPFQLQIRFPRLAKWAIPAWVALLACLPFALIAGWSRSARGLIRR